MFPSHPSPKDNSPSPFLPQLFFCACQFEETWDVGLAQKHFFVFLSKHNFFKARSMEHSWTKMGVILTFHFKNLACAGKKHRATGLHNVTVLNIDMEWPSSGPPGAGQQASWSSLSLGLVSSCAPLPPGSLPHSASCISMNQNAHSGIFPFRDLSSASSDLKLTLPKIPCTNSLEHKMLMRILHLCVCCISCLKKRFISKTVSVHSSMSTASRDLSPPPRQGSQVNNQASCKILIFHIL